MCRGLIGCSSAVVAGGGPDVQGIGWMHLLGGGFLGSCCFAAYGSGGVLDRVPQSYSGVNGGGGQLLWG